jgi:hypothetical protein
MMSIKARKLGKKVIVMIVEPYDCHMLQIFSEGLVVSWLSPCARTPWQMMDLPRNYVIVKGMLEPGG